MWPFANRTLSTPGDDSTVDLSQVGLTFPRMLALPRLWRSLGRGAVLHERDHDEDAGQGEGL